MRKIIIMLFLISNSFSTVLAQYPTVNIPNTQTRKITSKVVAGQEYELQISLPAGYENSTKKYPVVYLLDSQWDFPLVYSIYGEHYFDGFLPELILVGVTWGGSKPNPDSLRARDYTPTQETGTVHTGGADSFLNFMKTELFPFMETNYKADTENRSLMGCSLGGLFSLYALLTHTDMFSNYIAASPAVGWDNEVLYQYEKKFSKKSLSKPTRLYLTVGDVEKSRSTFEKFSHFLIENNYPNLLIRSKVLENTGHSGTKSETYSRGLQFAFERNKLNLNDAILNKYTGTYQFKNGDKIALKNENNQLTVYFSEQNKIALVADSENHFYSTHAFFNLYFKGTNGKIEGFDLGLYGNTQTLKKLN